MSNSREKKKVCLEFGTYTSSSINELDTLNATIGLSQVIPKYQVQGKKWEYCGWCISYL